MAHAQGDAGVRSVRFSRYGGPEVLEVVATDVPVPGAGEVVVGVVAAGLNPVETSIREGRLQTKWPVRFPAGQGSDFAGLIARVGPHPDGGHGRPKHGHDWQVGDAVLGHTVRGAQATFVRVPVTDIVRKPERLSWEVAGSLYTAAVTAWNAVQEANPQPGRTVLVHAAAGGVGGIAAQLAKLRGARVIGTASPESFDYLRQLGVIPVQYGPGLAERLARIAPDGVDAELDHLGDDAIANAPSDDESDMVVLAKIATMVADRQIVVPVAAIYPFDEVEDAYRELEAGHAHGKIVLGLDPVDYPHQKVHGIDVRESEATRDRPDREPAPPAHEVLPPVFGHPHHHPGPAAATDRDRDADRDGDRDLAG
jgi:NADPH:quinone reductase-like Zn-dependent oxidoreductase